MRATFIIIEIPVQHKIWDTLRDKILFLRWHTEHKLAGYRFCLHSRLN